MRELVVLLDDAAVQCVVARDGSGFLVHAGDDVHRLGLSPLEPGVLHLTLHGRAHQVHVARNGRRWFLHLDGQTLEYEIAAPGDRRNRSASRLAPHDLGAPMPGAVTQVLVGEGDTVTAGQPLVIIEAMKMEHVIRAPRAGRIHAVHVRAGDRVEGGIPVVELTPEPAAPDGTP
jgi:biotin carboxyl carrier protein